jgi:hypothetical protein
MKFWISSGMKLKGGLAMTEQEMEERFKRLEVLAVELTKAVSVTLKQVADAASFREAQNEYDRACQEWIARVQENGDASNLAGERLISLFGHVRKIEEEGKKNG